MTKKEQLIKKITENCINNAKKAGLSESDAFLNINNEIWGFYRMRGKKHILYIPIAANENNIVNLTLRTHLLTVGLKLI